MKIRFFGHSCFLLAEDGGVRIVTDPYEGIGYSLPANLEADAVTVSHSHFDHCNISAIGGNPTILREAGSYTVGGVQISTVNSFHDEVQGCKRGENLIFRFHVDGLYVCHLGDLGEPCTEALANRLLHVDVLLIPVGGNYTIDCHRAAEYVQRIRPAVVIPMHYSMTGGTIDIAGVDSFLKLFDGTEGYTVARGNPNEIELTKHDLDENITKIIVMER